MRRFSLTLLALALAAAPALAQNDQGQLSQLPARTGPLGGVVVECVSGCGSGGVGASVDISSVGGTVLAPGGPIAVSFGGSLPTGANTIGAINLAQYTPNAGRLPVLADINGSVAVTGTFFQPTQPISAASLPLPTGAATDSVLQDIRGYLDTVETKLQSVIDNQATLNAKDFATQATLALIKAKTDNLDALLSTLATASGQTTGNGSLSSIDTKLTSQATAGNQTTGNGSLATLAAKDFATSAKQDTEKTTLDAINAKLSTSDSPAGVALNVALPWSAPLGLPKPLCNAIRRTNCAPKGF